MAETLPEASKDTSQVQLPPIPPLPNPSAGSANPAASFPALWGYIEPVSDHIVRSPTNNPTKAPAIAVGFHPHRSLQLLHRPVRLTAAMEENLKATTTGSDLYEQFDRFVKRPLEKDKGWLQLSDMLDAVARSIKANDTREKIAKKWREQREVELKKWGLVDGASAEQIAHAETSAEAASPWDRIVPLSSIVHRRFRIKVLEPLLSKQKAKKKPKGKARELIDAADIPLIGQKGRLARAINLLEMKEGQESIWERIKIGKGPR